MIQSRHTTLVSAAELAPQINDSTWRVFDCRHDLQHPQRGRSAYTQGHVPGAWFLHLDDDLSGPRTGRNGRHPLPDPDTLVRRLAACGVSATTQVVAYDEAGGAFAARLWWLLRWLGHDKVAVLDGGMPAWLRAGGALQSEVPACSSQQAGELRVNLRNELLVDVAYVQAHLKDGETVLLDARAGERFRGEVEPLDAVAGHIPGALNRDYRQNLDEQQYFRPAAELRAAFAHLLGARSPAVMVNSCGSGVTACHNLLAMEIAGLPGARLYAGSWSEWCADSSRPVATGA